VIYRTFERIRTFVVGKAVRFYRAMFNAVNGNGATVTEKLGLDSEVRELKFGSSFNQGSKGQPQGGFHTIR